MLDFEGTIGDNDILGTDGADTFDYIGGNDVYNGGLGDDIFKASGLDIPDGGSLQAIGGAGNDAFRFSAFVVTDLVFEGGDGNDMAHIIFGDRDAQFDIDLGSGDDDVFIGRLWTGSEFGVSGQFNITLGDGRDSVTISSIGFDFNGLVLPLESSFTIHDFEAGSEGDILNMGFSDFIGNWDGNENPFDIGAARIMQRGDDAVLQFESFEMSTGSRTVTAIGWSDVVVFENFSYLDFTAENFNGLSIDNALQDPTFVGSPEGDILTGRNSDDLLLGEGGNDTLSGVAGDDILEGGAGGDELDGGSGIDTASYEGSTNRVVINMATDSIMSGHATGDRFISIENVTGSRFGDTITGDGGGNVLSGENGQDVLSGFNGDDTLLGGAGRDLLTGGAGADALDGGVGIDMVRYVGSNEGVTVDLGAGTASGGHADGDLLISIEQLFGSSHADVLTGDAQNNFIFGSGGDDILDGAGGIDKLFGGSGADTFIFGAGDGFAYVTDWENDIDSLDLSQYGFSAVADAMANMDQRGDHVRFFMDGETLLILNADLDDLADDIIVYGATI